MSITCDCWQAQVVSSTSCSDPMRPTSLAHALVFFSFPSAPLLALPACVYAPSHSSLRHPYTAVRMSQARLSSQDEVSCWWSSPRPPLSPSTLGFRNGGRSRRRVKLQELAMANGKPDVHVLSLKHVSILSPCFFLLSFLLACTPAAARSHTPSVIAFHLSPRD
jgi:hypothetical protein